MTPRLLALAFATALVPFAPTASHAVATPAAVCTSLALGCGGCSVGSTVRVTVIGHGYGEATCGGAYANCTVTTDGACSHQTVASYGSSSARCYARSTPGSAAVAICTILAPAK